MQYISNKNIIPYYMKRKGKYTPKYYKKINKKSEVLFHVKHFCKGVFIIIFF